MNTGLPGGNDGGHVFLSYVREDDAKVSRLQNDLEAAGFEVWRDVKNLWPGDLWETALRDAIQGDALAFVPCFSKATAARAWSTMFEELTWAAEEFRRRNPDYPWIFPVFFDDVDPPDVDLGAGKTLGALQWALLHEDWDRQVLRLVEALRRLLSRSPGSYQPPRPKSADDETGVSPVDASILAGQSEAVAIGDPVELLGVLDNARAAGTSTDINSGIGGEVFWYNEMAEAAFVRHPGLPNAEIAVAPSAMEHLLQASAIAIVERARRGGGYTFMMAPTQERSTTLTSDDSRLASVQSQTLLSEIRNSLRPAGVPSFVPPFGASLTPVSSRSDPGRTGRQLMDLVKQEAEIERAVWRTGPLSDATHLGGWGPGTGSAEVQSTNVGVQLGEGEFWRMTVGHRGELAAAVDVAGRLHLPGQPGAVAIGTIESVAARLVGIGVRIQRAMGLTDATSVLLASGALGAVSIPEVIPRRDGPDERIETHPRPITGPETQWGFDLRIDAPSANDVYRQVHIFGQRVYDGSHGADLDLAAFDGVRQYLEEMWEI